MNDWQSPSFGLCAGFGGGSRSQHVYPFYQILHSTLMRYLSFIPPRIKLALGFTIK